MKAYGGCGYGILESSQDLVGFGTASCGRFGIPRIWALLANYSMTTCGFQVNLDGELNNFKPLIPMKRTVSRGFLGWFVLVVASAFGLRAVAQTAVPGTFKHIAVDGSFGDWAGVPLAYTAPAGSTNAIQYENVYIANDQTNLFIRFTLYSPRANAFANSYDNIFIDADGNIGTGFPVSGIGSEMLIQWGGGYQEKNGTFNDGTGINNLGWGIAGSADSMDFELSISLGATFASDGRPVFTSSTVAILLEGDDTGYVSVEFVVNGGLVYTLASAPTAPATNLTLVALSGSAWQVNASGTDLSTNWLDQAYDDSAAGWTTGHGLFGYTTSPGSYPTINTVLSSGPTTYYFRTHFQWTNDPANVAFIVTNYLSDGAVYYLNGSEVRRVRMSAGAIAYSTTAAATNSPVGHPDVFSVDGAALQDGDNIMEVETHQAAGSSADMVLGLSLTAAVHYPVLIVSPSLPADKAVLAGQSITFSSDVTGSGPLTYQWFFNGTNAIAGATGASYTIPLVLTNDAGLYSLVVSNAFSSATTRGALLTVSNIPVSMTSQPANQVVVEGKPVTFTVGVAGTPLIQYKWFFGDKPITDATNASYTINSCFPTNAGSYKVTVSNPAGTTNSSVATLSVLLDTLPPAITNISAGATQIVVSFSEPVDPVTSTDPAKYSVSGGLTAVSAVQASGNPAQVTLNTTAAMSFGSVYTLTVNGVKDLFGNASHTAGQFTRGIIIDGAFDDWTGVTPAYSSDAPSGILNAADFKDIYVYNDADYYYFRVTLWADIDPSSGQFPDYVNLFFDTDNNPGTGYGAIGSEMLVQSGFNYQEKNDGFNDGFGINGLNWLCVPAAPGTNFEFRLSRAAAFQDATLMFSTNQLNFMFQGQTPGWVLENQAPPSGAISYTNTNPPPLAPLPLGQLAISALPGGKAAIVWDPPGGLQQMSSLGGGSWTNLPAATSPYVIPASGVKQFFRVTR
jgi:Bacterial Ig-like domain/Immunoglobulin I-set domain